MPRLVLLNRFLAYRPHPEKTITTENVNIMRATTLLYLKPLFLTLIAGLSLSLPIGCSFFEPHKIVISQGSWVDEHKVDQLELGMSKDQVNYLLGTPLLKDLFAPDNWVYSYRESIGTEKLRERRLKLDFNDDSLARIEKQIPKPSPRQVPPNNTKPNSTETDETKVDNIESKPVESTNS